MYSNGSIIAFWVMIAEIYSCANSIFLAAISEKAEQKYSCYHHTRTCAKFDIFVWRVTTVALFVLNRPH